MAPRRATLRDLLSPGPSLDTEDTEVRWRRGSREARSKACGQWCRRCCVAISCGSRVADSPVCLPPAWPAQDEDFVADEEEAEGEEDDDASDSDSDEDDEEGSSCEGSRREAGTAGTEATVTEATGAATTGAASRRRGEGGDTASVAGTADDEEALRRRLRGATAWPLLLPAACCSFDSISACTCCRAQPPLARHANAPSPPADLERQYEAEGDIQFEEEILSDSDISEAFPEEDDGLSGEAVGRAAGKAVGWRRLVTGRVGRLSSAGRPVGSTGGRLGLKCRRQGLAC